MTCHANWPKLQHRINGILCTLLLLFSSPTMAGGLTADKHDLETTDVEMKQLYAPFQQLLERHLEEKDLPGGGLVTAFDYRAALVADDTFELLETQNRRLAAFDPDTLATREHAVAFWLNAYNYFMIAYLLENPRRGELVGSVRDYGSLFNPYRVFGRDAFDVGGSQYSLDEIEKEILLGDAYREKGWKEARVHFAVNCASVGCPPLRETIYTPPALDRVLDENTRRALLTERHLKLDGDTLYLTRLFDWYENDYAEEEGSVPNFIRKYASEDLREAIEHSNRIRFIDYDWDLNEPRNFPEFD